MYPGEEGGRAIAETIAGDNNPAGRLPVTFYRGVEQLPEFADDSMKSRTYRDFDGQPLYPFGYGLSYSSVAYSNIRLSKAVIEAGEPACRAGQVRVGDRRRPAGDEGPCRDGGLRDQRRETAAAVATRHQFFFSAPDLVSSGSGCTVSRTGLPASTRTGKPRRSSAPATSRAGSTAAPAEWGCTR